MVTLVTLDSSVFIAAIREEEAAHIACIKLLEDIKDGKYVAIEPYTVLIEVVTAVKRRTGSSELASDIKQYLELLDSIFFLELTKSRADECAEICEKLSVRGMDSIVIQTAKENGAILITLDKEMESQAKKLIKTAAPDEFLN